METSRDDFIIALRSAFLKKGTQQRFSLLSLIFFNSSLAKDISIQENIKLTFVCDLDKKIIKNYFILFSL